MLCRDAELFFAAIAAFVFILQDGGLFQYLAGIAQKLFALFGDMDAFIGSLKDDDMHLLLQIVDRVGQAGLGNKEPFGSLGDAARLGDGYSVF